MLKNIKGRELVVSALHTIELAVCLVIAFVVLKAIGMESEAKTFVGGVVLAFAAKFVRESAAIPVRDWVNEIPFAPKKTSK